jgi:hypothetical protein
MSGNTSIAPALLALVRLLEQTRQGVAELESIVDELEPIVLASRVRISGAVILLHELVGRWEIRLVLRSGRVILIRNRHVALGRIE